MSETETVEPRRRLRELLAIPERDRTDEQWDEIIELEIQMAPGNREAQNKPDPGRRQEPRPQHARRPDQKPPQGPRPEQVKPDGTKPVKRFTKRPKRPPGNPVQS
jgi:hypothetical protein